MRELTLRGIGMTVVGMYVEDLGGQLVSAGADEQIYAAPNWRIQLTTGKPARIGALQVGVTLVRINGSEPVAGHIEALLSRKVLRAGG